MNTSSVTLTGTSNTLIDRSLREIKKITWLNPDNPKCNAWMGPLRFLVGTIASAVSPILFLLDLIFGLAASAVFALNNKPKEAKKILQDVGISFLMYIPASITFPFLYAFKPSLLEHI